MYYRKITSPSNSQIRKSIGMLEAGRKRIPHTLLIEGPHLIVSALAAGADITCVFFTGSFGETREGRKILTILSRNVREIFEVTSRILGKIGATETPRGIVAIGTYAPLSLRKLPLGEKPFLTVVDGIQDPGNLGTIIRTSDAAGADGVLLLPGTCDPFMSKTVRATAGSIFNVPVVHTVRPDLLEWIREKRIHLAVTAADAAKSIFDADLDVPVALVFGNEARGVSEPLRKAADLAVRIPIHSKAESLNVATSAAICLYEAVRQREKRSL
jgi:TrmH family RNA methyltransferase